MQTTDNQLLKKSTEPAGQRRENGQESGDDRQVLSGHLYILKGHIT